MNSQPFTDHTVPLQSSVFEWVSIGLFVVLVVVLASAFQAKENGTLEIAQTTAAQTESAGGLQSIPALNTRTQPKAAQKSSAPSTQPVTAQTAEHTTPPTQTLSLESQRKLLAILTGE